MNQPLMLREEYARERTLLSLDRTLLSYMRTSMTTIVVGVTFFKFFESTVIQFLGVALIFVAIILTVIGIVRSIQIHKKIGEYTLQK